MTAVYVESPPWADESRWPTAEEWLDWLATMPRKEQVARAQAALDAMQAVSTTGPTTREYVAPVKTIEKVTDGDTYWFHVDPGYRASFLLECRLLDYDTPETRKGSKFERARGKEAFELAQEWFRVEVADGRRVWCRTEPDPDDFGRWLAEVWSEDKLGHKTHLGEVLKAAGLATDWPTRWYEVYDPHGRGK